MLPGREKAAEDPGSRLSPPEINLENVLSQGMG